MNMEVQLPEIDTETKQRVVNYFSKAAERGQVIITLYRDELPDDVEKLEILNFAPAIVTVPEGMSLRKVDLAVELQILSFYQQRRGDPADAPAPTAGAESA